MGVCVLYQICAGWIIPSTEGNSGCWRSRTFFPRSKRGPGLSVSTWRIHIQVVQRHRKFLRFSFRGKAYQYKVLRFGLALAPRMFTKCMDAALAPLRLQGIQILNYLDDWLILAGSREQVIRHRDSLLFASLASGWMARRACSLQPSRLRFWGSVWTQPRCRPVWALLG